MNFKTSSGLRAPRPVVKWPAVKVVAVLGCVEPVFVRIWNPLTPCTCISCLIRKNSSLSSKCININNAKICSIPGIVLQPQLPLKVRVIACFHGHKGTNRRLLLSWIDSVTQITPRNRLKNLTKEILQTIIINNL